MTNQSGSIKFNKIVDLKGFDNLFEVVLKQLLQLPIADVAGGDQKQVVGVTKKGPQNPHL